MGSRPGGSRWWLSARSFAAPCRRRSFRRSYGRAPQDALIADAARDPVGVETLEQQLRRLARRVQEVAEAPERDRAGRLALFDQHFACTVVRLTRDREAVADADEPPLLLEEARELLVVDLHRLEAETRL